VFGRCGILSMARQLHHTWMVDLLCTYSCLARKQRFASSELLLFQKSSTQIGPMTESVLYAEYVSRKMQLGQSLVKYRLAASREILINVGKTDLITLNIGFVARRHMVQYQPMPMWSLCCHRGRLQSPTKVLFFIFGYGREVSKSCC